MARLRLKRMNGPECLAGLSPGAGASILDPDSRGPRMACGPRFVSGFTTHPWGIHPQMRASSTV
jgi:hypothetical protein